MRTISIVAIHGPRVHLSDGDSRRVDDQRGTSVNHPPHYNAHPSGVECIDVVEHMTFNVGNAVKYLWRAGLKGGAPIVEDLRKARWYIDREIQKLEKESKR